ncbi:hypothetical protein [Seleniivibrio sp.]|uniref:hypothetical protein n=1 Tax=Seleniivibrio sp. TaxID=2898801 RepID=UPI0025FA2139|nr:hypothetical protein [Seleniivibrio sp.]MCD8553452.1 hypothetical protein [Seleniivibrio sp.]
MIEELLAVKKYVSVVHHVEGRIRLKVDPAIMKDPVSKRLEEISASIPGVLDKRVNMLARSVVLRYDPAVIHPVDMAVLFGASDSESLAVLKKYEDFIS